MRVYRIERKKYLNDTLRGIGASLSNGSRWNSYGTFLVYTAESRALAMLEVSVHLDLSEDLPTDRLFVEIDIPDDVAISELSEKDLPKDWDEKPPNKRTQFVGDAFVRNQKTAVLKVPSSIVHEEFNFLINPLHSDAKKIKIMAAKPFLFDKRWNN